jgi:hypothetical protein
MHRDPDPDAGPLSGPAKELKEREPFTSEGLLRHIVNFIVADDQVHIFNVSAFIYHSNLHIPLIPVSQRRRMPRVPSTRSFSS